MLKVSSEALVWFVEKDTMPGIGQGDYVVSHKRLRYAKYERGLATGSIEAQADTVYMLQEEIVSVSEWMMKTDMKMKRMTKIVRKWEIESEILRN